MINILGPLVEKAMSSPVLQLYPCINADVYCQYLELSLVGARPQLTVEAWETRRPCPHCPALPPAAGPAARPANRTLPATAWDRSCRRRTGPRRTCPGVGRVYCSPDRRALWRKDGPGSRRAGGRRPPRPRVPPSQTWPDCWCTQCTRSRRCTGSQR